MACEDLQKQLTALQNDRRQQIAVMASLQGAGLAAAQAQLARIDAEIGRVRAELETCLAKADLALNPIPPRNVVARVDRIECHTASREVGKEEPYVLVAAFDMANVVNLGIIGLAVPALDVFKVGPWSRVEPGTTRAFTELEAPDRPFFWGIAGQAFPIATPQSVIFLAAMMEHDGSSPDAIRGAVRANLLAARATNTNLPYATYVARMISNMTAAIETARVSGLDPLHLNEDDLIGRVQQLTLSNDDLQCLQIDEPVEKTLRFTQRTAKAKVVNDYTVTFTFVA